MENKLSEDKDLIHIGGIEKFSIVDWPGKIAAVAFLQGCPWRCPFCYNQSLQTLQGPEKYSWEEFLHLLATRQKVLDAVVFSGGEPLMQKNLVQAIEIVREMGFAIGMHSGGYNPEALQKVIDKISWIGFDIKSRLDDLSYSKAIGCFVDVAKIRKSLQIIIESGIDFECRTTCDPRILNIEDIYYIADELNSLGVKEYHIQKYRPIPSDITTSDYDCEKFFADNELLSYLQSKFAVFDVRK